MFKTFEEAKKYCADNEIKQIDFKMVDLDGRWRHLSIPVDRFTEDTMTAGIGFDGSNYGFAPVENSDMVFIPDLSSAAIDPFVDVKTLTMIGDVYVIALPENYLFDQNPRSVTQHAVKYMQEQGIADKMMIGPEFEFHVFDDASFAVTPNESFYSFDTDQAEWNSGAEFPNDGYHVRKEKGYHIAAPLDRTYDFRSAVCEVLEANGIKVKYHHHEVGGPGQVEIEVEFGELTEMADKTLLLKYIVKNMAVEDGRTVTFMPKPILDEAGNGMHVHMHLFKDGEPLFYDPDGYAQLSKTAMCFMGGILKHIAAICAFTNPSTNSFKRLVPGYEAPVTVGYATANRSAVIRIPAYAKAPDKKRFELRNPDATCNPYYAYAAILMAGIDGIKNEINASDYNWGPFDFNLFSLPPEEQAKLEGLPKNLDEALDALEADHDFLMADGVFPERLIKIWIEKRRADAAQVNRTPHPAEFALYYDL
ncbi:MAG: type I glutamate--ammonia ligase [bacterium]|nr:type I glutamate--ammonia ligase [Coriobacteriales bacterium]MCR5846257.1 type I glutamate--ammonia ligase [bacterium]